MAVNSALPPFSYFVDLSGAALENGYIYIGQAGFEARSSPKASYFDLALAIPTGTASGAAIRTSGGFPVNTSNAPAAFYVDGDYSISVCDRNGVLLYSALSMTLAINVGGAATTVLSSDGSLGAAGLGFASEPNTGFSRNAPGSIQIGASGVLVATMTSTGAVFSQPVSGAGFTSGVLTVAQPVDPDLTAIAGLSGTGIAVRTAANTWANRQVASSDGSVTITNPAGIAGDIGLLGATRTFSDTTSAGPGTTVDVPGLAGWESIEIDILTTKANTGQLLLRVSFDNGGSYQTSGYAGGTSDLGSDSTNTTGLLLARDTTAMTFRCSVRLAKMTTQAWLTGGNYGSTSFETMHSLAPAGTVNAIRLFSSGGNLTNTTIQVTGVRRA